MFGEDKVPEPRGLVALTQLPGDIAGACLRCSRLTTTPCPSCMPCKGPSTRDEEDIVGIF
jgi:hypothetical protein